MKAKQRARKKQKSAKQIGNIIGEILENTNEVVGIAKVAFKIVQTQGESVEGTKKAFVEMKENIDILLAALEHITHNVENMDGARSITLESVESISVVAGETAACSATVTETVESQNNAISDLDMAANTLSAKASQLTKLLGQFTV